MTMRRGSLIAIGGLLLAVLGWGVARELDRFLVPEPVASTADTEPADPPAEIPRITATLFYASRDGRALIPVQREVPLAEGAVPQGREILSAQLEEAPEPYLSAIPEGTALRAFYVTERGDAFVDLSLELTIGHPGGSFAELLTVHTIVNAVTANLPSIQRVQILIEGTEADTLAGHIDLRRPLERDVSLVREPAPPATP